jgi:hypothetical protein
MPRVLRLLPLFALSVAAAHLVGLGSVAAAGPTSPAPALRQCNEADDPVARLRGGCAHGFSAILEDAKTWNPILLAFIGTSFGWFMTALGSAAVIVHGLGLSEASYRKMLDFMLGISGGVMTAASYWSLLAPALEFAAEQGWNDASYVPVAIGFLSGGVLLQALCLPLWTCAPSACTATADRHLSLSTTCTSRRTILPSLLRRRPTLCSTT